MKHIKFVFFLEKITDKQRTKHSKCFLDLRPLSSSPCNCTSSNGIMCCLLYFFLLITMLPYTRISLNKKNCLAFGRLRHILVSTPSPTKTRPWIFNGYLLMHSYDGRKEKIAIFIISGFKLNGNKMNLLSTHLPCTAKTALHHIYSPNVRFAIY